MRPRLGSLALAALLLPGATLAAQPPTEMRYSSWQRATPTQLGAFSPTTWLRMDTVTTWVLVPGTPAEVFRKTHEVYQSLKLKVPLVDSLTGLVGNPGFNHTGALAGRRMSSWIRCGEGMTGPFADTWRITMAVISWIEPLKPDTSKLRTTVMATARNLAEGSGVPSGCVTSGEFEAQVHKKVLAMPPATSQNE